MDAAQAPAGVVVNIEALAGRRGSNAPAAPKDQAWKKFLCHVGPGFMVSLAFLDPQNCTHHTLSFPLYLQIYIMLNEATTVLFCPSSAAAK